MNSPLLQEATGGTDTQQLFRIKSQSRSLRSGSVFTLENCLLQAVQNNDIQEVQIWLERSNDVDITQFSDQRKYSLLHFVSFNNQYTGVILLVSYVKQWILKQNKPPSDSTLHNWINRQTDDGFTALHFAAYRGNLKMIEYLMQLGCDITIKNKHGMNALHISAQGDQPISLTYFRSIGLDFNEKDNKGGTPLHWASFYGCEQAVNYILSWNIIDINMPDNEGLCPLHLACMSGNSRVVKRLLIKGAKKNLKDHKGLTPNEIAKENEFLNIDRMLTEENSWLIDYYNVKPGFKQVKRSKNQLIKMVIMSLFVIITTILVQILEERGIKNICPSLFYFFLSVQTILIFFIFVIWQSDPGYLGKKDKEKNQLMMLLKQYECFEICPECEILKVQRSKHCDICKRCVGVYDHHCPWVDNCIGKKNHGIFYLFILSLFCDLTFIMILNMILVIQLFEEKQSNNQQYIIIIFTIISIVICFVFFLPILLLILVQTKNLLLGQTTYERYSQNTNNYKIGSDFASTQSQTITSPRKIRRKQSYSCYNCYDICIGNIYNKDYIEIDASENSLNTIENSQRTS